MLAFHATLATVKKGWPCAEGQYAFVEVKLCSEDTSPSTPFSQPTPTYHSPGPLVQPPPHARPTMKRPRKKFSAIKRNCFELLRSQSGRGWRARPVTGWCLSGVASFFILFKYNLYLAHLWPEQDWAPEVREKDSGLGRDPYRCLGALTVNMFAVFDCCQVFLSAHKTRRSQCQLHIFGAGLYEGVRIWERIRSGRVCGFCKLAKGFIEFSGVTTSLSIRYGALLAVR